MLEQNFKQYKPYFELLDQLFEVERKLEKIQEDNSITRNLNKMKDILRTCSLIHQELMLALPITTLLVSNTMKHAWI